MVDAGAGRGGARADRSLRRHRAALGSRGYRLRDDLLCATTIPELVERLASALAARVSPASEPTSAHLARQATRLLEQSGARVEVVATRLGVTARHLRRAFTENIGVSPRDFARSARLQRAVRLSSTGASWLQVALDAGYCDQPHMNADFRDLVGLTPAAFAKRSSDLDPALTVA